MKNRMIIYDDVEKVMKSLYKSADTELKTEFLDYVRTIEINDDLLWMKFREIRIADGSYTYSIWYGKSIKNLFCKKSFWYYLDK